MTGFSFDATVPANTKSTSQAENSSTMDDVSEDSYSNADRKSEKPFETESAYAHSEDESAKSPAGSPTAQKIFESPTKEDSFNHFGKSFDADTERYQLDSVYGLIFHCLNTTKRVPIPCLVERSKHAVAYYSCFHFLFA